MFSNYMKHFYIKPDFIRSFRNTLGVIGKIIFVNNDELDRRYFELAETFRIELNTSSFYNSTSILLPTDRSRQVFNEKFRFFY